MVAFNEYAAAIWVNAVGGRHRMHTHEHEAFRTFGQVLELDVQRLKLLL